MAERKAMLVHHDDDVILDEINDAGAGKLFKALLKYSKSGEVTVLDQPDIRILYTVWCQRINHEIEAFEETCRRNAKNGKKGGRPKNPAVSSETQKSQSKKESESEKEPDSESEGESKTAATAAPASPLPNEESGASAFFLEVTAEVGDD